MKKFLLKILDLFPRYRSYSQHGEDMVMKSFYDGMIGYKGFYVDIGAHHPIRFSNTQYFYKQGWRGINVDATPGSMKLFNLLRRRDINLEMGIAPEKGEMIFYCFDEPALNGFNADVAKDRDKNTRYKIIKEVKVPTMPLSGLFSQFLPKGQKVDFMTIDVEGLDLEVLKSNDWEKYRPDYLMVEDTFDDNGFNESAIHKFLHSVNYKLVARTTLTSIYKTC